MIHNADIGLDGDDRVGYRTEQAVERRADQNDNTVGCTPMLCRCRHRKHGQKRTEKCGKGKPPSAEDPACGTQRDSDTGTGKAGRICCTITNRRNSKWS